MSLKAAIDSTSLPIFIGGVEYFDWEKHYGSSLNSIGMSVRKAEGYKHENEVRLVLWDPLTERARVPGERPDSGESIDAARISREVLAALAGYFPSLDFTTVDGRQLVL